MSGIESCQAGGLQSRRSCRHPRIDLDYDTCSPAPATDLRAAIRQRVLGVLEIQNLGPGQLVQAVDKPLQDGEDSRSLRRDTLLILVIERPVETVEI